MTARPLKRVIYREPGEGVYLSGYQRYLFSKAQAMRYVKYFNKHVPRGERIIFLKSANRFVYLFEGRATYLPKGKEYMTVDGLKVLYNLDLGNAWDIVETKHTFRFKKPTMKKPAPFGL